MPSVPFSEVRWLERDPVNYEPHRGGMEGGLENPLGAPGALSVPRRQGHLYRIHGTPDPGLFNQDARDLFDRVHSGTKVVVLDEAESGQGTLPPAALPPTSVVDPTFDASAG